MYLKILFRESLFYVKLGNWYRITPSSCSKGTWNTQLKFGKASGPSARNYPKNVRLMSKVLAHQKFGERSREETLHQERCARRIARDLATIITNSRMRTKLRFIVVEARPMLAPTSKRSEERKFVVDSGASMHMMSKRELSSDELDTHHCGAYSQLGRAYKRGSTSILSRPQSLRDSANARRNACCSIAWKTLRRPRPSQTPSTTSFNKLNSLPLQPPQQAPPLSLALPFLIL